MTFNPKSQPQIVADMAAEISARTPLNDLTPNSVLLTLLEAAAQEDAQQYIAMIEVIRNYSLDTTEGSDLDKRAFEFGITRLLARPHSGYVTLQDTRFTSVSTKLYAGLPGPAAGSTQIFVDDASSFPSTGSFYVGRNTANLEGPVAYSAVPVNNTAYWAITLDTALLNDHGTDETIVLSQYGIRVIKAGAEVRIPENDFSSEVVFELNQTVELLDGVASLDNVLVTALQPGATKVPKGSIREFVNAPFTGATVYNFTPFVNGRDLESDQELRDRIRVTIQSLSRGTVVAISNGILGIIDNSTNSSITSANVIPPVTLSDGPTKVYIDNGRGLEPEISTFGLETLQTAATGGEKYFQLAQFPLFKASILSQLVAPYALSGLETIILKVGTSEETFTFAALDFTTPGSATASEVAAAINNRATLFEARTITTSSGARVIISSKATVNEDISLDPASTANVVFNFTLKDIFTLKLYKNDKLLTKDGLTASTQSAADPFDLSGIETTTADDVTVASASAVVTKSGSADDFRLLVKAGDYVKSSADTDNFYTQVKLVASASKLILKGPYPAGSSATTLTKLIIFSAPQLEIAGNGDLYETEVISFSKNDFASPNQALASEVLVRINKELNLSKAKLAVNDRKVNFESYLQNSSASEIQVVGGQGALSLGFSTKFTMTGTITVDGLTNIITGSGSRFTQELIAGQWIRLVGAKQGAWTKVLAIESDTSAYFSAPYNGPSGTSSAEAINMGALAVGSNKDYTLNRANGQIELVTPLVAGDSLTAGSINTRAFADSLAQPFNFKSIGSFSTLIVRVDGGISLTVTTADTVSPYGTITAASLAGYPAGSFVGYHIECISGNNLGSTEYVASYNPTTGALGTTSGFAKAILAGDKFALSQVISFTHSADFSDPQTVSALEVVTAINKRLIGSSAQVIIGNKVRIRTNNLQGGKLAIIGGTANTVLAFTDEIEGNQESNLGFIQCTNSDRSGMANALGYTLSPTQNLVVVIDNDNANKTYSTLMRIEGKVTSAATGSVSSSDLISKYPTDASFADFWLFWKAGATNEGRLQKVTGYVASTGTITFSEYFPSGASPITPAANDVMWLVPRTAENLVTLLSDLNSTTLSISAEVAVTGNTGDFVQIATKRPGTLGKVNVRGGTANSLGITIQGPVAGSPINDIYVNSVAGLYKGLPVKVTTTTTSNTYFVSNIQGTTSPYVVSLLNSAGVTIDASTLTLSNNALIKDVNALNFSTTPVEGVDAYKFHIGLIQLAQWTIDGLDRDRSDYPGIGAAGTQFEVISPVLVRLKVVVNVTPIQGTSLSSISNEVSSRILEYVNSRKVGEDVILSEIIAACMAVSGVFDAKITNLTNNVTIADGELARLTDSDLIVG